MPVLSDVTIGNQLPTDHNYILGLLQHLGAIALWESTFETNDLLRVKRMEAVYYPIMQTIMLIWAKVCTSP